MSKTNIFLIVIALIFLIVCAFWFAILMWRNASIMRARSWPYVQANVIESYWRPSTIYEQISFTNPNQVVDTITNPGRYSIFIIYEYIVNGKVYTGNTITYYGPSSYSASQAQTIVDQNPKGSKTTIHYNPSNPSETYIYVDKLEIMGPLLALIVMLLSGLFIFWSLKTNKSKMNKLDELNKENSKLKKQMNIDEDYQDNKKNNDPTISIYSSSPNNYKKEPIVDYRYNTTESKFSNFL